MIVADFHHCLLMFGKYKFSLNFLFFFSDEQILLSLNTFWLLKLIGRVNLWFYFLSTINYIFEFTQPLVFMYYIKFKGVNIKIVNLYNPDTLLILSRQHCCTNCQTVFTHFSPLRSKYSYSISLTKQQRVAHCYN